MKEMGRREETEWTETAFPSDLQYTAFYAFFDAAISGETKIVVNAYCSGGPISYVFV